MNKCNIKQNQVEQNRGRKHRRSESERLPFFLSFFLSFFVPLPSVQPICITNHYRILWTWGCSGETLDWTPIPIPDHPKGAGRPQGQTGEWRRSKESNNNIGFNHGRERERTNEPGLVQAEVRRNIYILLCDLTHARPPRHPFHYHKYIHIYICRWISMLKSLSAYSATYWRLSEGPVSVNMASTAHRLDVGPWKKSQVGLLRIDPKLGGDWGAMGVLDWRLPFSLTWFCRIDKKQWYCRKGLSMFRRRKKSLLG